MRTRRAVGIVIVALFALTPAFHLDHAISKFYGCRIVRLASIHSPDGSKSVITFRKEWRTVPDSNPCKHRFNGCLFLA